MEFRIADTFTDSLGRLTGQEQKAVKTAAFDLQMNAASPGLSFHKLDRAKDANFWSVRVNADIRLIVHKTANSLLLAYVGHHDGAYKWAERRKIERHPATGAMQLVEMPERVEAGEGFAPKAVEAPAPAPPPAKPVLFDNLRKFELMAFGVPAEWVEAVRAADEDTLFEVIAHLPAEAQEALLKLAVGEKLDAPPPAPAEADPFAHPDAGRRFRVIANAEELMRALEAPWEKWAVFLHPAQAELVERDFSGPARVSGSAGTGKTVVALHRAVHLARRNPAAKVLLTTFSNTLANALRANLRHLVAGEPSVGDRIVVKSMTAVGYDLYAEAFGQPNLAPPSVVRSLLTGAADRAGAAFSPHFLFGEWTQVVDGWGLANWEAYESVARLGRKTRLGGKQRAALWAIFEAVRAGLRGRGLVTWPDVFGRLAGWLEAGAKRPFDFAVIDEAQDLSVSEARFLAALDGGRPNALFFAGDPGQRIFQQPFSWKALGIDIRGRSHPLRINYRTSHQIRRQADRLLPGSISEVDGETESRAGTISVFDGPEPGVRLFETAEGEGRAVGAWLAERAGEGCPPEEIAVFVRSERELKRARAAAKQASLTAAELTDKLEVEPGRVSIGPMHLAKGLEFRAVAVMACDEDILPLQERIETALDDSDLEEVYDTERHLLYVACTRARDHLLVTGLAPGSEFLADFGSVAGAANR